MALGGARVMRSISAQVVVPEPPMGCSLALSDRGALCTVEAVQPASRAAGAGVREGDVLLTANGQAPPIESESERALVDFFRRLRYPLRLAFARRAKDCLLYTSPSPRDKRQSRMPSSA